MRLLTATLALVSLMLPTPVSAQEPPWGFHGGMQPMWWMWHAWGLGMMVMMLVFWGLVIVGLVVGVRWLMRGLRPSAPDRALDILRERYARGDISKEEFDAKLRDLGGRP